MGLKSLERVEGDVYSRVSTNSMANRRVERIENASVEGVPCRVDYLYYHG